MKSHFTVSRGAARVRPQSLEMLARVSWRLTCCCLTGAGGLSVWTPGLCSEVLGGLC